MVSFKLSGLALFTVLSSLTLAHPDLSGLSDAELIARKSAAKARHLQARSCTKEIAQYNAYRKAKRQANQPPLSQSFSLRGSHSSRPAHPAYSGRPPVSSGATALAVSSASADATATTSGFNPIATAINNNTCITAPEVTEGPYYINNEFVRQDLREIQTGVTLTLDLGIMDTSTCTPLSDAFVEIWSANATGYYAGFGTGSSSSGGGGEAPTGSELPVSATETDTASASAVPSDGPGGNGTAPGGDGIGSSAMPYNETFNRGGWTTNSEGIVEFLTTYPGFYTGRTIHIHMMVHTNYSVASNGTIISHEGSVAHIGQIFFDDAFSDQIMNTTTYLNNQNTRTLNDADSIFQEENSEGNNALADTSLVDESDLEAGVYAYLTVGVDGTASYSIASTNYNLNEDGSGLSS